ncbi:hypothetical protein V6N11_080952 [Hibiscus sabdariffa]|uniref:Uncharacterized protein n=1 Tax=Hibiscus sabdariffa TaxID=183260 RepID=A0ABR2QII9_9ROSI
MVKFLVDGTSRDKAGCGAKSIPYPNTSSGVYKSGTIHVVSSGENQDINTAPTKLDQRCTKQVNIDRGCVGQLNNDTSNFVQVESEPATSAQVNVDQASIEQAVSDQFEIADQEL